MSKKARRRPTWKRLRYSPKKKLSMMSLWAKTLHRIVQEEINKEVIAAIVRTQRIDNV